MWQSGKESTERNVADTEKQLDSGHADSGFLSGANLVGFESSAELELAPVAPEPMRADSGVDLGLSESLSQLTLKQVTLNALGGKVQSEPTVELTPVTTKVSTQPMKSQRIESTSRHRHPRRRRHQHQPTSHHEPVVEQLRREPWELHYAQDDDGDTQLHLAIVEGFLEAAFSLIRMAPHACLLDILNDDSQSPVYLAVLTRQPRIARRLVLAGADLGLRNFHGNTALHLACASGDLACARALTDPLSPIERSYLASGRRVPALPQNLEQRNYNGEMCLHLAAANGHVNLVRLLLRLGADLEARETLSGKTALHLAVERGCRSVVAFLLQECRPCLDAPTYAGITAYQIAARMDIHLAKELVRLGATPEPPPESDSETSNDESDDEDAPYFPTLSQLRRQSVVGVRG